MEGDHFSKLPRFSVNNFCQLKTRIVKFLVTSSVLLIFITNVYFNIQEYQRKRKVVYASRSDLPPALLPPFTFCVYPSFNPLHLVSLGLNISVDNIEDLEDNINNLNGIEGDMAGSELVEKAAWKVEDFVEEVRLGNAVLESYTTGNVASKMWHRTFTPLGPCWMFIAPTDASLRHHELTISLRHKPLGLQQCNWVQELESGNYNQREMCVSLSRNCNTSCVWEAYVQQMFHILYGFISSTYYTYNIDTRAMDLRVFSGQTYEVFPYRTLDLTLGNDDYSEKCFFNIISEEVHKQSSCVLMNSMNILKMPINRFCITGQQMSIVISAYIGLSDRERTHMEYLCEPKKVEYRWKLKGQQMKKEHQEVTLRLASSLNADFYKKLAYPLSKLLEDVGGSLGLFLGISLLDLWLFFPKFFSIIKRGKYITNSVDFQEHSACANTKHFDIKHFTELYKFSGVISLAIPFCIQCWIIAESYVYDSQITSVSIERLYDDNELHQTNLSLKEALLVYVASRSFGCQSLYLTDSDRCLFHCLLEVMPNFPLSSHYLEDLPVCHFSHVKFSRIRYVLQGDIIDSASLVSCIDPCENKCESFTSNVYSVKHVKPIVSYESSTSFTDVVCGFGGIVGLYFGFSMQLLPQFFCKGRTHRIICSISCFFATFFICLMLSYSPLKEFFYDHPVYSETSTLLLSRKHLPTITICMWPPFNLKKLFTVLDFGESYENIMHMNFHSRNNTIAKIILSLNNSGLPSQYSPKDLWVDIAWSKEDLNILANGQITSFNRSIFGTCHFIDWSGRYETEFDNDLSNIYWTLDPSLKNITPTLYAFIHNEKDFLPVVQDVLGQTKGSLMTLESVSTWTGRDEILFNSEECTLQCLDNFLVEKLECLLPWVEWRSDLNQCNFTQFMQFLTSMWLLRPGFDSVYKSFLDSDMISFCKETCQSNSMFFYSINFDDLIGLKVGNTFVVHLLPVEHEDEGSFDVSLRIKTTSSQTVREVDGYPVSQLMGDIGGIIGITMGVSLLSICLAIMKGKAP